MPPLRVASRATAEEVGSTTWASEAFRHSPLTKGQSEWMAKLKRRDLSGVVPKLEQFLPLTGKELTQNPRQTREYKDRCLKEAGLGKYFDEQRYPHITEQVDRDLLAWAIKRGSGCI